MNTFYWKKWNKKRYPNVCVSAPDSSTNKIYSDSMYICVWDNAAHMSTILPVYIVACLMVWNMLLFMLSIKSWMVEHLLKAYYTLFNMLRWNATA
jgi:hypothetical protein